MFELNDVVLESIRAAVLFGLIAYLLIRGRHLRFARMPGISLIVSGFFIIFLGNIVDITDEFPTLARFVILGDTLGEAIFEKIFGYLGGFICLTAGFIKIIPAISRSEETEKALRESETRFRLIFESSPDLLIITSGDEGEIIDVNQAFVQRTGISAEDAKANKSFAISVWADLGQRDKFMQSLKEDGLVINMEADFRMKDGEIRTGLTSAQLIKLGNISCILTSIRDITQQKQAERVLVEMDRVKSEFISTAAHELRTPLTTMIGYTDLLRSPDHSGDFTQEQRAGFLKEISQKGEMLGRIIDEMLDISRIENGRPIALDLQPNDLKVWLSEVVSRYRLQSAKHTFLLELPGRQPPTLTCDQQRMDQVLDNLLSNAVKYSSHGGAITIRGEIVDADYVVSVTDQGIGMTPEQVAKIFDKFYRADASNTAIGGIGLGMSISKQMVEMHGGKIWVESESGMGTTIRFSLPIT